MVRSTSSPQVTSPAPDRSARSAAHHVMALMCLFCLTVVAVAQQPGAGGSPAPASPAPASPAADAEKPPAQLDVLALNQGRVADKYAQLEQLLIRMAEFEATNNPQRSALLKRAAQQSADRLTRQQLNTLVKLLSPPSQLQRAFDEQQQVVGDLKALLELLQSEDRSDRLKTEQAKLREYIAELNRLLRLQAGVQGETEGGGDQKKLADEQEQVAGRTRQLDKRMQENEPGQSPAAPGASDQKKNDQGNSESGENAAKGESKPGESKPGESKPGESKPGESKKSSSPGAKSGGDKGGEQKPGEQKPGEQKSNGEKSDSEKSDSEKSDSEKSDSEKSDSEKSQSEKSSGKASKPSRGKSQGQPNGEPSESGESPDESQDQQGEQQNPVRKRLQAAEDRMREAQRKLTEAKRKDAVQEQEQAREELEKAKAELERILRQLREEEIERTLALLEGRFRRMLEGQLRVYESTKRLDRIPADQRTRDVDTQASKLGFDESKLVVEAEKALLLLREEGSSVAFPETVEMVRDDMQQVSDRLAQSRIDRVTQGIEEEIVQALEELVAALQKAQQELREKRKPSPPRPGQSSDPNDRPLVDQLAELKMIRSLQLRVNTRTQRYARLLEDIDDPIGRANDADLRHSIGKLGELEQRVFDITRNIVLGRNE